MKVTSKTALTDLTSVQSQVTDRGLNSPAGSSTDASTYDRRVLRALRRIVRAIDLYSSELKARCGLTVPQLICLSAIVREEEITSVGLALQVHLSPSTLVGIIDRLERAGLIHRERSTVDRRQVMIKATDSGVEAIRKAPSPLQDNLANGLAGLPPEELSTIALSLERIVELMEAHEIKVAPLLTLERKSYAATTSAKPKRTGSGKTTRKSI
jgi:DNA-binding MarR family transcriptional regulator